MIPATLVGFIGKDPETQVTQTNKTVTRLRVGCPDRYRDANGDYRENETFWAYAQAWGTLAQELATYKKGTPVVIVGEWKESTYEVEGKKRSTRYVLIEAAGINAAIPAKSEPQQTSGSDSDQEEESTSAPDQEEGNPL